jgi:hypothetical protein
VAPKVESSLGWFYFLSRLFPFNRPMLQPYALDIGLLWNAEDKTRRNINEAVHWSVEERVAGGQYRPKNLPTPLPPGDVTQPSPAELQIWQALA